MRSKYSFLSRSLISMITTWLLIIMMLPVFPGANTKAFMPTNTWANRISAGLSATHESITDDVIEEYDKDLFRLGSQDLTSGMKEAMEQISLANAEFDQKLSGSSAAHFDGENFSGGQNFVTNGKLDTEVAMVNNKVGDARKYLGQALHTLQDFYSHSNWVELGRGGPYNILGVPNNPLFDPPANLPTCTDCSRDTCTDCLSNLTTTALTTGYFGGEDRVKPPDVSKCSHGGKVLFFKDRSSKGAIGAGINKDTNNCNISPHSYLHSAAALVAEDATRKYLDEIKKVIGVPRMRLLLGGRLTLGMAIDTTGSMGGILSRVKQQAVQIINARIGTDDEPNQYLLVPFNDPDVGPIIVTDDPAKFKLAISNLEADGGDDCPELSMTGMREALNAIDDNGGELMMFTDASSKDSGLAGTVEGIALSKNIKIEEMVFGSCSPIDPAYIQLANDTGGQLFIPTLGDTEKVMRFADTFFRTNMVDVLNITSTLAGVATTYDVPVDSTMTSVTFSVSGATDVVVTRPDNSFVQATDVNVNRISWISGAAYSIASPVVGTWHVRVNGTGSLSLRVMGESPLDFSSFDFVELQGRPLHEGFFPIPGFPQANQTSSVVGEISPKASSANFALRNPDGTTLQSLSLEELSWATEEGSTSAPVRQFMGEITTPAVPFRVYVTGVDLNGVPYQRVKANMTKPQSLKISPPDPVDLTPGQTTTYTFTVTNLGDTDTFNITAADDRNFLSAITPSSLTLGANETANVAVVLQPTAGDGDATIDRLTVTAKSASAYNYAQVESAVKPASTLAVNTVYAVESSGNGNGMIDPGEVGSLNLALYNLGDNTASGASVTVTSTTPGVTIQTGTAGYPDIAPGGIAGNSTPLTFTLGPYTVCGQHIDFTFSIAGGGATKVVTLPVQVGQTSSASAPTVVSYTGPAVTIPAGDPTGVDIPIVVSGFTGAIADLDFSFDGSSCTTDFGAETVGLDDSFVGELTITLISPQGKRVVLLDKIDFENNVGSNFCNTLLDDESTGRSVQELVDEDAPNSGSFKPATPLSAFDGENPNGTWILHVSDASIFDFGHVRAFSLHLSTFNCNPAPADTTFPTCDLLAEYPGPPLAIDVGVQDIGSGIASVIVSEADNVTVYIPSFIPGTTEQLISNAALFDQTMNGSVELTITDRAGNVTVCDPVVTTIDRRTGAPTRKIFSGIAQAEHNVTVHNSNPGLTKLDVVVNGTKFQLTALHASQVVHVDVSGAMRSGNNNTIEIVGFGPPGSRAAVLVTD